MHVEGAQSLITRAEVVAGLFALHDILEHFKERGCNMRRIQSRAVAGDGWEYVFYVDCQLQSIGEGVKAIKALQPHCAMVKELGTYREATKLQNTDQKVFAHPDAKQNGDG